MMCSAFAERDAHFVRDVRLRRVMCLRAWVVEHITSLLRSKNITASIASNITVPQGTTSHHPPAAGSSRKPRAFFVQNRLKNPRKYGTMYLVNRNLQ